MPKLPFRRKPSAHGPSSLLRFLFPRTLARARTPAREHLQHLHTFRHETLSSLRHRAQARIYRYILHRQTLKLRKKPGLLQRLRSHTRTLTGSNYLENEARRRRRDIAKGTSSRNLEQKGTAMSYQDDYEPRESGGRRRKLAGYLKAANELRQSYTAQYAPSWRNEQNYKFEDDTPGGFPDAAIVRSGEEEMILFPSYARKHIKRKPEAEPGTIQETEGEGRDSRDTTGAGDAEFWKKQWENYEDDNAVVDVDIRGWIYSPFKGQMSRKQRLFIGLARQLVGIQAPPAGADTASSASSRDPSPGQTGHQARQAQRDEILASREAEEILRKGEKEAAVAAKGGYSEKPARDGDDTQLYRTQSRDNVHTLGSTKAGQLSHATSRASMKDDEHITPPQKRGSWNHPDDMSPSELALANTRLMARLRHFLAVPMANTPISIFFYNDKISKQRTVYTDASGHFNVSAALDFIPTNVRILASDQLSATEEVIITNSNGISVISDIDDTIKHSAISSGAREIFRNAFIRELDDLTIGGVKEWYNAMADQGVKFHYVSNSPWQLFPVISKYFELAGLPPGSFHLKQYSGMLQGIFEPVAERKKVTLDKIARDFPERRFILIGDSGEADLEVYTDFVLENPGRVAAVFIRDVTTSEHSGFFDPSVGPTSGNQSPYSSPEDRGSMQAQANKQTRPNSEEHDPELKAAIAASLRQADEDERRRSKSSLFPEIDKDHPNMRPKLPDRKPSSATSARQARQESVPNLIDLSSEDELERPAPRRVNTDTKVDTEGHRMSAASTSSSRSGPPPPRKPQGLRSHSNDSIASTPPSPSASRPPPPPKPRRLSNTVTQRSPLSQATPAPKPQPPSTSKPAIAPKPDFTRTDTGGSEQSYAGMAKDKLWSVYNQLPALRSQDDSDNEFSSHSSGRKAPPPPPPRRRDGASNAVSYVGSKANAAWQHAPSVPYHSRPQVASAQMSQPFSTSSNQRINRTNTGSTLGANGAGEGQQYGNKREILWRQRWAKAEEIMREKGVVLRSWRVGMDVQQEAIRIIKEAERKGDKGEAEKERGR